MTPLSARALLGAWEAGAAQHPLDRALTVLLAAGTAESRAELAALPLAERDARLLGLRAEMVGPDLSAFTTCGQCGERLEFSLDTAVLAASRGAALGEHEARAEGWRVRFRLPDSRDAALAARTRGVDEARRLLAERCLLEIDGPDGPAEADDLPEPVRAAVGEAMAAAAPTAEVDLELACPACGAEWRSVLDVPGFFWTELAARARRLLGEVHTLARAYHWSENEILSMTPRRRRAYLDLVEG
ncbi:phage baseplate protein [Longimicrobium terrae]|uniref:Phage baseplate protein n=1 Tax=Longimicrobium terrae TaxID=1639882 RepID=A0A841GSH3_9BACT|nr:phage baseplate protein [Longimicrobium terrae]MBB4634924.1 hypothetical protein [Longimicrobium terrae]MBB6069319.1 hypothetical protein [Longimicrobium terrae]NNC31873.1 phage baseplate protein [Longimicrobium terrae]